MKAINNFDASIRGDLRPYAHACIVGEIKRFFRDKRWLVRVSRRDQELLLSAKQARATLTAELGGEPTDEQVIERSVDMDAIRRHWHELTRPQRRVLLMRFYGNMTQAQVADRLHCSQMHVSRMQSRALDFLRGRLLAE
jgi:RNA polymerase sigma-B factor